MPRLHFTDLSLRSLKTEARADYWDTNTPGFGVRVGTNTKTFIVKVENRRITLGQYPDLSLAEARKLAHGQKAEAKAPPGAMKFERAVELFIENYCKPNNRERVWKERQRILQKHWVPEFRSKSLDKIEDQEIGEVLDELMDTPSAANHAFKELRTFFRWAAKPPRRYVKFSPLTGMEMPSKEKRRKRVLSDGELFSVWNAALRDGYPYGTIIRLLILTGQRRSEIGSLERSWINERERLITLPDWLCKNNVEHTFPYGDMVAAILDTIPRFNSTQLLFPARGNEQVPFNGWSKSKKTLESLPPIRPWVHHDLRRTFSTGLGRLDVPQRVNDRLLNHISQGEITPLGQVYNLASYLPQMRTAVATYEAHLIKLLAA